MTTATQSEPIAPARSLLTAADIPGLLRALGDIPAERVWLDPSPGTATEADVVRWVDGDDKRLVELVNGTLVAKTVGNRESELAALIIIAIGSFVYPRKLGKVYGADFMARMTGRRNIRLPDVAYVAYADMPAGRSTQETVFSGAMTLAVEVLSPSNTRREMEQKYREFFASGTRLVWEIDPDKRTVSVFDPADAIKPREVLSAQQSLDGGDVLPGLSLSLKDLFAEFDRTSPR